MISISAVARKTPVAPADNSEVDRRSFSVSTFAWVVSSPVALTEIAAWQSAAPFAKFVSAFAYSFCIAASGIFGPTAAVATLLANWLQAYFIDEYCLTPPDCRA